MSAEPPIIYDFDPRNLPPELLRAVGLVVAASARTEAIVQTLIGGLLQIDEIEAIALSAHMSAPLRDQIARSLMEINAVSPSLVHEVDALLDVIGEAARRRNAIVHNSFVQNPDTGQILSLREAARGSLRVELKPVTVEEIEQEAALIYESGMALYEFMTLYEIFPHDRTRSVGLPLKRGKKARESLVKGALQKR
ncbi:hypothetical protein GXW78_05065 [Roseomonas terrae]|uniref:Uncharacterized protein n=2 Tax=Neoroseomonas terrae TaxID=424799 RepID=A0ABS5EDC2_9PROT|nr:hypothetical protein [Neoroseomonas terrae]